jgi:anaerobic selenocysteine-containing dehydrogenase
MATHFRACNLCEAICGLEIETDGMDVVSIRGDKKDPLSHGHLCPKGVALQDIYEDTNRLTQPIRKTTGGGWEQISWETAYADIAKRTISLCKQHGSESMAVYLGNPTVHNYGTLLFNRSLINAIGRPQLYSATSVDQLPHHFASSYMFGHSMLIPVPDVDRTNLMLIIGANPLASNGSLMTAPGIGDRINAIRSRGGRIVLIDPRRTETARVADAHHFIRPGSDVWFLAGLLNVIFEEQLDDRGRLIRLSVGRELLEELTREVTPEIASARTGIDADTIRTLAREFTGSHTAVCYGRMGLSTQPHGGLCQWLVNALNIVTGNLDRPGGAMFATPVVSVVGRASTLHKVGRWTTRVRKLPEFDGQLPVSALSEEILTPGKGQVHSLFTICGNPTLSTPNGRQLDRALESLELMVSVDIYINETTRHADFILPPTTGLEVDHYDLAFHALAIRNTAKYSPVSIPADVSSRFDWQILSELARRIRPRGGGLSGFKARLKDRFMRWLTPTGILDLGLKLGPYGAWRSPGKWKSGLTLKRLRKNPHGIDLGPLRPQLPNCLRLPSEKIDLVPDVFAKRFRQVVSEFSEKGHSELDSDGTANTFQLIGRRNVRSNNSWMHNSERLTRGKNQCTLLMNPQDVDRLGLEDGQRVVVSSRVGGIDIPLELSDSMMPGVISIPHGYGHNRLGSNIPVAEGHAGESINDLTDELVLDQLTGNAAFSGLHVTVSSAPDMEKELK